jgi:F-type H+-transporting ATPase subunit alpha
MTGLPIIETKANDISAFIPTNVISITDGQLFLQADLFNQGVRPAINVGTSVSRVGGNAQIKPMRRVAGTMRLGLAQYRDMEAFALFASDLDQASRQQLERGARLVELLKQGHSAPVPVEEEVVAVWAGTAGKLDDVPTAEIARFESEFLQHLRHANPGVLAAIADGDWSDDVVGSLDEAISSYKDTFLAREDGIRINEPEAEAIDEEAQRRETVKRVVPKRG